MIKITIDNKTYDIPERLTVAQWQRIVKWDLSNKFLWPNIVSAATGAPVSQLAKASTESLELAVIFIMASIQEVKICETKDLNTLTFGQFVDLDIYLVDGIDKHLDKIAALVGSSTQWADEALYLTQKATEWRNYIYKEYRQLFGLDDVAAFEAIEAQEPTQYTGADLARSWYDVIYTLANENVLHIDPITELPLKQVLNFLAIRKEKIEKQNQETKQKQRQLKLA